MNEKIINIGLVGVGGMGSVHYANYREIEGCRVAAVVGGSEHTREKAAQWGVPAYPTITDMVNDCDIDIVDICTPTYMHHDGVMESLSLKKHTIVEKPIALHKSDALEMLDAADKNGCLLFVAQVLQFTKEIEILHRLVESEEYGKPLDGYFERLSACPRWAQGGWMFEGEKSGLVPFDLHIHDLDVIVSLFGKPDEISYTCCGGGDKSYREQYRFNYRFGDLNIGAEAGWFNADIPWTARWRVYFENGMVINDGQTLTAYQFGSEPRVFDTHDKVMVSTGINVPPCGWYYNELKHFISCVREGHPSPRVSREQLLTVVEILENISKED